YYRSPRAASATEPANTCDSSRDSGGGVGLSSRCRGCATGQITWTRSTSGAAELHNTLEEAPHSGRRSPFPPGQQAAGDQVGGERPSRDIRWRFHHGTQERLPDVFRVAGT